MHTDFHFLHQLLKRSLSCKGNSDLFNRCQSIQGERRLKPETSEMHVSFEVQGGFLLGNDIALVGPGSQVRKTNTVKSVWRYLCSKLEFEGLLKSTQSSQQRFSWGCLCCHVSLHGFWGRSSVLRHHKIGIICSYDLLLLRTSRAT